jgi:hypothetical protein
MMKSVLKESLESDWAGAKSIAKQQAVIKKYDLVPVMSKVRPGEVKLGVANELKMNPKKKIVGLDSDGKLISLTGWPIKITYTPTGLNESKSTELTSSYRLDYMKDSFTWNEYESFKNKQQALNKMDALSKRFRGKYRVVAFIEKVIATAGE